MELERQSGGRCAISLPVSQVHTPEKGKIRYEFQMAAERSPLVNIRCFCFIISSNKSDKILKGKAELTQSYVEPREQSARQQEIHTGKG
ncbi:hypothetical protein AAFN90_14700 [Erwiniaceae bacterium CAU 1747]